MSGVARMVLEAAQSTLTVATHNGEAVAQSAHDFDDLKHDMTSLALIASELYNQSEKVGDVMDFLNEVADETHLLGINATIEASEAGMQGLRFGVVAAEVQNLADRSRRSTQQVKLAVNQVKAGIEKTFKLTSQGLDKAAQTAHISQAAGLAIDQIIANADNSTVLAQTISGVRDQQQNATNYVAGMIKELEVTSSPPSNKLSKLPELPPSYSIPRPGSNKCTYRVWLQVMVSRWQEVSRHRLVKLFQSKPVRSLCRLR